MVQKNTHTFFKSMFSRNICKSFAPKQTERTAQGMAHLPERTDQMEQLVYFAASVCSRPTTGRWYSEHAGQGWREKQHIATPKPQCSQRSVFQKNFEEIFHIIAKRGVDGRQLALAKTTQQKKTQSLNYHPGNREERGAFSRRQLRIWQASGGKERVWVKDNANITSPDNRER